MNTFLTADIKISTDSQGYMTAEHVFQGLLIDSTYYAERKACRKDAVEVLRELKSALNA